MDFFRRTRRPNVTPSVGGYPFAVLDVETTGLWAEGTDRIIEIGVVLLDPALGFESEYTTLVHPDRDMGATHIHGITGHQVLNAPPFAEVADDLERLLMNRVVVGFNVSFDMRFLRAEFLRLGIPLPAIPTIDLRAFAQGTLDDACQYWGVDSHDRHRALGDARTTAALFSAISRRNGIPAASEAPAPPQAWPNLNHRPTEHHRTAHIEEAAFEIPTLTPGMALCFTGDSGLLLRGEPFTRDIAEATALSAGFVIKAGVSRKVNLVVTADVHSLSGKARRARELNIPLVPEVPFWHSLGYEVHRYTEQPPAHH